MANAHRLIEIFTEAKARTAGGERERFLAEACPGDPELKEQVVSLLQSHEGVGDFLKNTIFSPTVLVREKPGDVIGRYKLLEKLGEGGYGVVYVAEQTAPVRRRVALKVIKLGMDTKQVVARFEAERQALAMMDHPNIAKVLDAGATDTGRPYFVMEVVRGIRITDYCDQNNLSTRERLDLFIKVCQAIQHAHQKAIIHRDIKPSNILVTMHDATPVPKVIDFGIAKATEGRLADATVYTQLHQFIGTPAYMSPEQAEMSGLDIDTRSDIYSLGVLLYELLTGKTPFDGQKLMASGLDAMRKTIREIEPVRPSTRLTQEFAAADLIPGKPAGGLAIPSEAEATAQSRAKLRLKEQINRVRGDLDWIVMKCLEKDRARRYETANGLAADLNRHLNNEPVIARPPSATYKFQKAWRRNKLAFAAGTAVSASLVIGMGLSTWLYFRAVKARDGEKKQRLAAEKAATERRESLYASEMSAAFQAWREGRMSRARDLLEKQRPPPSSNEPDLRSFDWRYLWKLSQPTELFTLTNAATWGFALSPDGHTVAGYVAAGLSLWNTTTRLQQIPVLATNASAGPFSMSFSPDGKSLATAHDRMLKVWDVANQRLRVEWTNFNFQVLGLAFSPDGKTVVTAGGTMYLPQEKDGNGEVRLWDAVTGRELPTKLGGIKSCAYNVTFSPDGQMIAASGAGDGVVALWHIGTGEMIGQLPDHYGFVWALGFSHDGRLLATADEEGYVWLWDWAARRIKAIFHAHDAPIYSIAFSPDDERLVTASRDRTAKLWDCKTRKELARFAGHEGGVTDAKFLPDGQTVVTSSNDSNLKFWNAQIRSNTQGLVKDTSTGQTILFSPGGRFLMRVASSRREVTFLDPATGNPVETLVGQNVATSADGTLVLLRGSKVVFLDPSTRAVTGNIDCGARLGSQPAFSPDGKWLAFRRGDRDPTNVVILDVQQKREVKVLATTNSGWAPLSFTHGGTLLVTASWGDDEIRVWDTASWREITNFPAIHGVFRSLTRPEVEAPMAVSPDGKTLACAAGEGSVRLWDMDRLEEELPPLRSGAGGVYSIAFSPDGKTLAIGALDRTVKLWNLAARQEVTSLIGHSSRVSGLAFSPDGRILASTALDTTLRLWPAPSWQEIEVAMAAANGPRP